MPLSFAGMLIREDPNLYDIREDWSDVRSPGRARRRRWKHKQRIRSIAVPKPDVFVIQNRIIVGHPVTIAKLLKGIPHD